MPEGIAAKPEPELDSYLKQFFEIAFDTLKKENDFLVDRLGEFQKEGLFRNWHQHLGILAVPFEEALVYLIFRNLLKSDFVRQQECEVRPEERYPGSAKEVDLLLERAGQRTYVECKIWMWGEGALQRDIDKMRALAAAHRRLLLFWSWDDTDGAQHWDYLENRLGAKVLRCRPFPTKKRDGEKLRDGNVVVWLVEDIARAPGLAESQT